MTPIYAVVASGFAVSGDIDLRQRQLYAISVPTINSGGGGIAIQGNYDTTSARFVRMMDVRGQIGSGDLLFSTLVGSRMAPWPAGTATPPYARVEITGGAQVDTRTFVLLTTPRR
jgi:hypothetical protein